MKELKTVGGFEKYGISKFIIIMRVTVTVGV